jgi:hypothetical protein
MTKRTGGIIQDTEECTVQVHCKKRDRIRQSTGQIGLGRIKSTG